jgi:hypothetical protein
VRWRLLLGWLGAWAAAGVVGGCGDGTPAARGFGSWQAVQLRDPTFVFVGYAPGSVLYGTTSADGMTNTYWQLDAQTGALQNLGDSPSNSTTVMPPSRFSCTEDTTDKGFTFTVTDTQTGVVTTIDGIVEFNDRCPTESDPSLTVWRSDGTGHLVLWTGRYDDLQAVALPLVVDLIVGTGAKTTRVTAEQVASPGNVGIYDIDTTTAAVSEVVPPTLGAAVWADGATPVGTLASTSVVNPDTPFAITQLGNWIFYERTMSDGGKVFFASSVPAAPSGELALFRLDNGATVEPADLTVAGSNLPPPSPAWLYLSGSTNLLFLWDTQKAHLVSCPGFDELRPVGYSSLDGRQFIFGISQVTAGSPAADQAQVVLISPDGNGRDGTCTVLGPDQAHEPQMSSDGALAWLVDAPGQATALWTAAADGSAAREIGQGSIDEMPFPPYFFAPSRLEFRLDGDLAWVDVRDDPVKVHYVAEQVFDQVLDFDQKVIVGYDFNGQDGSGSLGLVDRNTGDKRLISTQVADYEPTLPPSGDSAVAYYIAYLVRGRNPSSQDGLWIATIMQNDVR